MLPVYLRFAGLHSYSEEQQVDFSALLGAGVFGIFGPTGSGKSTILDAITLALYGSVERAIRNTQGIINQYCDQTLVAFTFELTDTEGAHRYRVERTFRRGKVTDSVEAAQARFLELGEGRAGSEEVLRVLADKASTVTAQVEAVLGLNLADFTRAVVLPQGRFAEFLTLRGSERRSMLQRLFRMELYGDRLLQCVREELQKDEGELNAVQAAQAELGDASHTAVQAAASKVVEVKAAHACAVASASAMEQEYAAWSQVWSWQGELKQVWQQLNTLLQEEAAVQSEEKALAVAERAERVRSLLSVRDATEKEAKEAVAALHVATEKSDAATMALQKARTERAETEGRWIAQSPGLYNRQADLRHAKERETHAASLKTRRDEFEATGTQAQIKLDEVATLIVQVAAEASQATEKVSHVRQEMARRTVDPALRTRVAHVMATLERLTDAERQHAEEQQQYRTAASVDAEAQEQAQQANRGSEQTRAQLAALQNRQAEHTKAKPWDEQELLFRRKAWQSDARVVDQVQAKQSVLVQAIHHEASLKKDLAEAEERLVSAQSARGEAVQAFDKVKETLRVAEQAVIQAQHDDMAATLASGLMHGAVCPVCGSSHHPKLAVVRDPERLQKLTRVVEGCRSELAQAEKALMLATERWTQEENQCKLLGNSLSQAQESLVHLHTEMRASVYQLPRIWQMLDPEALPNALKEAEASLQAHEKELLEWQNQEQNLDKEARQLTAAVADADKQAAVATAAAENARKVCEQADERVAKANALVTHIQAELATSRAGATTEEMMALSEQLTRWDREVVALQKEEAHWAELEKEATCKLQDYRQLAEATKAQVIQAQEQIKSLELQLSEAQEAIAAITGPEVPVDTAWAEVSAQLESLAKAKDHAANRESEANSAYQQAMQQLGGAERRNQLALQRQVEAEQSLAEQLARNGFGAACEAQAALRSDDEREQLQAHITQYRQSTARWQQERERLARSLAGRQLSPEEWQCWQERLTEAQIARDTALQAVALAENAYNDVVQRHERWTQLHQQKTTLVGRVGRLQDLTSLLRGNAFVDFMAEQQLQQVAWDASAYLGQLTRYRYALEVMSDGSFVIRDDANGGYRRPVHTLSGGETFLTSLALALALSSQIQLRGQYPLQFFFLDEGFGSLDQELLDSAMTALERLHLAKLHVGVISHVPELRNRILRRLIVQSAQPGEHGSQIMLDQV